MSDYHLHLSLDSEEGAVKSASLNDMLHMSRRGLKDISASVLQMTHLKSLYLEGNEISGFPEHFFSSFPSLVWLDVRNNQITALPVAVGQHRCLKTLLLEGNPITELPPELGNLITLKALSLRNCPLTFPPRDVLDRGLPQILHYLRRSQLGEESEVEKLQLRLSSLDVCEEDDPDIQHFQELRHRIIQMERDELGAADPVRLTRTRRNEWTRGTEAQSWSRTDQMKQRQTVQELLREQRNQARVTRKDLDDQPGRRRDEGVKTSTSSHRTHTTETRD
ncbi:malignant fibrous histiocytoma-amplified sequence 1 homolog isoform X1 [Megalobrama amblycephala]|uniref:malignant fibrous histiocytoma-amplified sequence 1 homolog isoform X1 n=1 Tax=Megalobrama amblycephala TaxID=75352 RepID=UPI00201450C5|nr:malignant fibrous histiocytoma-amplified sequence 1 homolog isoform X1 [Megalobrama amblycephala]